MREFGQHLTIDASSCNEKRLTDQGLVYDILSTLPKKLGMHKMTLPYAVKWLDPGATVPGISGFVMIAESHISIHTFPEKQYVFIDVFSCKLFDKKIVEKFWPGPLTVILKITDKNLKRSLKLKDKIAIRVPNHKCTLELLKKYNELEFSSLNQNQCS